MKRFIKIVVMLVMLCMSIGLGMVFGQDVKKEDPSQIFYNANNYYQKQDYIKAVEQYLKLPDMGIANGNIYYNIGNCFLKLGKVGYALVCYERAKRYIPNDSDLRSNIAYAQSLADAPVSDAAAGNAVTRILSKLYEDYSLNTMAALVLVSYLVLLLILAVFAVYPLFARRFNFIAILLALFFVVNLTVFAMRYYNEEVIKRGIIVQNKVECKYEPIDKSTTYYTLREGNAVVILKTKDAWRQIRRPDGKIGWVLKGAVEQI
mgnify:CR=1 FL=1